MITILANALVPIFAALLFGYAAGLRGIIDNKDLKSFITFVMNFALPCSLFVTIARTSHDLLWSHGRIAAVLAVAYLAVYGPVYFAARRFGRSTAPESAVVALTLGFPNAAAVGVPLLLAVYGAQASAAVAVAIAVGSVTISPITLAILESGTDSRSQVPSWVRVRTCVWKAMKKPVFWAPMLGVLAVMFNLKLPSYVDKSLTLVGSATAATALFLTGLIVSAQRFSLNVGVGLAVAIKALIQPAVCFALARALGLPLDQIRDVVLISAIPCGFFGMVFGKSFNATPETASSSLIASYAIGSVTLAGWIWVLDSLH